MFATCQIAHEGCDIRFWMLSADYSGGTRKKREGIRYAPHCNPAPLPSSHLEVEVDSSSSYVCRSPFVRLFHHSHTRSPIVGI